MAATAKNAVRIHCVVCDNLTAAKGARNDRVEGTDVVCEHCKTTFVAHDTLVENSAPGSQYIGGTWVR